MDGSARALCYFRCGFLGGSVLVRWPSMIHWLCSRGGTDWVAVSTPFNGIPLVVWLGFTTSCRRTFERILRLLVSACFSSLVFHAVSLRPGLVKLLALSNFQARRRIICDSCFTELYGQQDLFVRYTICHRCFFPYDRMRSLVTGISNPMAALRRSSSFFSAPSMT